MARILCLSVAVALLAAARLLLLAAASRLHEQDLNSFGLFKDVPVVDPPLRIAGYFELNRTREAEMFYFFFQSRSRGQTDPVVLWMTGGPGCSSELAIMYENGPFHIEDNLTLSESKYGWDVHHNMLYVDQPIGVGFSYSNDPRDTVYDEKGVGDDMIDFLLEFFDAHPEFRDRDLYITGESYGGHYVPAVGYYLWRYNELGDREPLNLKGLAIGNGLTNPAVQFGAYADYAFMNNIISKTTHDSIQWFYPLCHLGATFCERYRWTWLCGLTLQVCQLTIFQRILASAPGINVYDIRKQCEGPLCYDFSNMDKYLNLESVKSVLGVGDRKWVACSPEVYQNFLGDFMRDYSTMITPLLEDGIRVMIYAGDKDLICNWLGNKRWMDGLEWDGKDSWDDAEENEWKVDGVAAGSIVEAGPLSFVKVYDAGHMVPMDQDKNSLYMITQFTRGKPLVVLPDSRASERRWGKPA